MNLPRIDWKLIVAIVMALATGVNSIRAYEKDQNDRIDANKSEIAAMKAERLASDKFIVDSEVTAREYRASLNRRFDRMEDNITLILKGKDK